jgi:hypothetical protein
MLRADVIMFENPRFFLSKDQDTSTSICETLEHSAKRSTDPCGRTRTDRFRTQRQVDDLLTLRSGKAAEGLPGG